MLSAKGFERGEIFRFSDWHFTGAELKRFSNAYINGFSADVGIPTSVLLLDMQIPTSKLIDVIQGRGDTVAFGSTTVNAWWLAE